MTVQYRKVDYISPSSSRQRRKKTHGSNWTIPRGETRSQSLALNRSLASVPRASPCFRRREVPLVGPSPPPAEGERGGSRRRGSSARSLKATKRRASPGAQTLAGSPANASVQRCRTTVGNTYKEYYTRLVTLIFIYLFFKHRSSNLFSRLKSHK